MRLRKKNTKPTSDQLSIFEILKHAVDIFILMTMVLCPKAGSLAFYATRGRDE